MKYVRVSSLFALLALMSFSFISCDKDTRAEEKMENAVDDDRDAWQRESREMNDELKKMRADIDARLEEIEDDMDDADNATRARMEKSKERLEQWGDDLDNRMHRIGNDVKDGWSDFKLSTRDRLDEIENELDEEF